MSAVILFAIAIVWFCAGHIAFRFIAQHYRGNRQLGWALAIAFFTVWIAGPFFDEWLGSRSFDRHCAALPHREFYGPVSLGEGLFFDASGHRRLWTQKEIEAGSSPFATNDIRTAYAEGLKFMEAWRAEFRSNTVVRRVQEWPVPVFQETITFVHIDRPVFVSHSIRSPGGWLKRATGWGTHAPYQCADPGNWPEETAWIKF